MKGEANGNNRLTQEDVRLMRELRNWGLDRLSEIEQQMAVLRQEWHEVKEQTSYPAIAEKFEVHPTTAAKVCREINWREG